MLTDEFFLGTKLYHKKFTELCKPLAEYLGVTHAIYVNIDQHGRIFTACTHKRWIERYIEEQYYKLDLLMVNPQNIHNGFAVNSAIEDEDFKNIFLYDAITKFDLCHPFTYVEKTSERGYFCFSFATNKDNSSIVNTVLNGTQIIKKFIHHLHKNLKLYIAKDLAENRMDFTVLKGESYISQKGVVYNDALAQQQKVAALKQIGLLGDSDDKYFLSSASLSAQEINCLRAYRVVPNIKQVARDLNLAVSTATDYIENIKGKLNCTTKNELLAKTEILESLGRI